MALKFHSFSNPLFDEIKTKLKHDMFWGREITALIHNHTKNVQKSSAIFKSCSIDIRFLNMVRSAPNPNSIVIQSSKLERARELPFLPFRDLRVKGLREGWDVCYRWSSGGPAQPLGVGTERYWQHARACRCQHLSYVLWSRGLEADRLHASLSAICLVVF